MQLYLGENIKKLRHKNNLTQETLADFLGVTFQSVSNWERGESYPDISLLPVIARFFNVSTDDLLGVNKAQQEDEIVTKLTEYDNLTVPAAMQEIIVDLKKKYPDDFRILVRYLGCLARFTENKLDVIDEVHTIYKYIQTSCTDDRIRIKSKRAIIEFYRALSDIEESGITINDCSKIINELPDMRDSREMFCFFNDKDNDIFTDNIRETLQEQLLLLNTVLSHYIHYDGFFIESRFSHQWIIDAFKTEFNLLNFIYDDGNYGKMWRTVIYNYGHLGVRYHKINDNSKAIENFRIMAELAKKFDAMERITIMHSAMFEGQEFDKHRLGSTYIASEHIKELLTEKYPLDDTIKNSNEFKEIINLLS